MSRAIRRMGLCLIVLGLTSSGKANDEPFGGILSVRLEVLTPADAERVEEDPANPNEKWDEWRVPAGADGVAPSVEVGAKLTFGRDPTWCEDAPDSCGGAENTNRVDDFGTPYYGCLDRDDNDGDGLVDWDDPDCWGVEGWSLSIRTEPCFILRSATTRETVGALVTQGGLRGIEGANFEKTQIVDPNENDGDTGVVSAVVLSLDHLVILSPGEYLILRMEGNLHESDAPTRSCPLEIIPSDQTGLRGNGVPVRFCALIGATSHAVDGKNLRMRQQRQPLFLRGDANLDGRLDLADAVRTVSVVVRGASFECKAVADANGDGVVDSSDITFVLAYLFLGGAPPPAPFPECGAGSAEEPSCAVSVCEAVGA